MFSMNPNMCMWYQEKMRGIHVVYGNVSHAAR
jgi:hypothetical protein